MQKRRYRAGRSSERGTGVPALDARQLVAALLLLMPGPGHAGDLLTPERLAQQADLLVVASVTLAPPGVQVEIEELLPVSQATIAADSAGDTRPALAAGPCLPDREQLVVWLMRSTGTPAARAQWDRALDRGGYRAVLALRLTPAGLEPLCETETLLAEHWLGHPDHAEWRRRLDAALASAGHESVPPADVPSVTATADGGRPTCPPLD